MQKQFETSRYVALIAGVFLVLAFTAGTVWYAPPVSGYTEVNALVGQNGESRLMIPIAIPAGTSLSPELTFNYNSQVGNGLLGQGFQLGGLYTIGRVGTNMAQDGFIDGADFDANDRYTFNGERLVLVKGAVYGADGGEYRTEQNDFTKVVSYGIAGFGPQKFKAWTKSGLIIELGFTNDSRIEAQGKTSVLLWLVNKISDTKGNYIAFEYTEDNLNGAFRLDKIRYTGNDAAGLTPYNLIQLTYETRPDTVTNWIAGSRLKMTHRLKKLEVFDNGSPYRTYELTYSNAFNWKPLSHIIEVAEKGSDGTAWTQPLRLDWYDENIFGTEEPPMVTTNLYSSFATDENAKRIRPMDVNGDGLEDIVLGPERTIPSEYGKMFVLTSDGNTLTNQGAWSQNALWKDMDPGLFRPADVTGDGKTDLVIGPSNTGQFWVLRSTGTGFNVETWGVYLTSYNNRPDKIRVADVTGDGRQDMIFGPDGAGNWAVLKSTGTSFEHQIWATGLYASWDDEDAAFIYPAELNGDGLMDLLLGPENASGRWYAILSKSTPAGTSYVNGGLWGTFSWTASWRNNPDRIRPTDVNGDGLTDVILGPGNSGEWHVLINNSTSLTYGGTPWITGAFGGYPKENIRMVDLTGDGLTDFLFGPDQYGTWNAMYNTGSDFTVESLPWLSDIMGNWSGTLSAKLTRPIDVAGDGAPDLIFGPEVNTGHWYRVSINNSENYPHLLRSCTTGHGAVTTFFYDKLTSPATYQKGTAASYPELDFIGPLYVTTRLQTDDGLGGKNSTRYKYFDSRIDLGGRGFRGFDMIEQVDSIRGAKTVTTFDRRHQFIGAPVKRVEEFAWDPAGTQWKLIHSIANTADTFEYAPNTVHFSFIDSTTEKWYEFNAPGNTPYNSKVSDFDYDRWGNVTAIRENAGNGLYTVITANTYTNDTSSGRWFLGRLTQATVTKDLNAGANNPPPITKTATFAYDPACGILVQERLNASSDSLWLQKDYTLDAYGNHLTETVTGPDIAPRVTTYTYSGAPMHGRYLVSVKNALNHEIAYTYERGLLKTTTDPNGRTETIVRDGFGRPLGVTHFDNTSTNTTYYRCDTPDSPDWAVYYVEVTKSDGAYERAYFDLLDREIRKVTKGLYGQEYKTDTHYDPLGRVEAKSEPWRDVPFWHQYAYDPTHRLVQETAPGNLVSTVAYNGFITTATNPQGQRSTRITNAPGWTIQRTDHFNNSVQYEYDSDGNMTKVTDPVGNITTMAYDSRGNKIALNDPDLGLIRYDYNTLGSLTKQIQPNGVIQLSYDLLDRRITQEETGERTLIWEYDTQPYGIGKVARAKINGVTSKEYVYNDLGQVVSEIDAIEGVNYTTSYTYEPGTARLLTLDYPGSTNLALRYEYDAFGHVVKIKNAGDNNLYWQLDSLTNKGQVAKFTLGNGLSTRRSYADTTGYLLAIRTGNATNPASVQNLAYAYSPIGNLALRQDLKYNCSETFQYDSLNRLTQTQVAGQPAVSIAYNAIGNIAFKSDVGAYSYGNKPHLVSSINHAGIPNCFYGFQGSVSYTLYNYPKNMADGLDSIFFTYNADRSKQTQRFVKNGVEVWKKHYVNGLLERVQANGQTKFVHHIMAMGEAVAVLQSGAGADTLRYLHYDHLGSLQTMSTGAGAAYQVFNYDAWGKARHPYTWERLLVAATPPPYQRGFTFHEMLGVEDLIHMNARLYDPAIGRMLSPDPVVKDVFNLQDLNRASYVINNPLNLVDPSGFSWLSKALRKAGNWLGNNVGTVVSIGLALVTGPLGAITSGAISGFGGAFAGTLAAGGDLGDALRNGLRAGALGGLQAGLSFQIGERFGLDHQTSFTEEGGNAIPKALAHGVVQGGVSELQGGEFWSGFASGTVTTLGEGLIHDYGPHLSKLENVTISAVIGGTASSLSGGRFSNGAISGAFIAIYNQFGRQPTDEDYEKYNSEVSYCSVVGDIFDVANRACFAHDIRYRTHGYNKLISDYQLGADIIKYNIRNGKIFFHPRLVLGVAGVYTAGVIAFGHNGYKNDQKRLLPERLQAHNRDDL